jgi:shikimate dehydrogenase
MARNAAKRDALLQAIAENPVLLKQKKKTALEAAPLTAWPEHASSADILVNTTPVGMDPEPAASVIDPVTMPERKVVMDIVYRPHWTAFLKAADQKRNTIVFGSEMLLEQGALQFTFWTGREAPVAEMRHALRDALLGKGGPAAREQPDL